MGGHGDKEHAPMSGQNQQIVRMRIHGAPGAKHLLNRTYVREIRPTLVLLYPLYRHIPVCCRIHYAYEINQVSYSII